MGRVTAVAICGLPVLFAAVCFGQVGYGDGAAAVAIRFPEESVGIWGRYVAGAGGAQRAGWIAPQSGSRSFRTGALPAGPNTHFRAILYVPGCRVETLDVPLTEKREYEASFRCEPVLQVELSGVVVHREALYGRAVWIDAKYVARWAPDFFGYKDGTVTSIPLGGGAVLDADGRFRLSIPDLSRAEARDGGELQLWARDEESGRLVAQLRTVGEPGDVEATRLGGIPIGSLERQQATWTFAVCAANPPGAHDSFGFGIRPDPEDACDVSPSR